MNSAKSALNGDEKLAAAKQTAKSDIGRLTDLNNAQRTAANAEVDQAPNLAAVTAAKNKATSLNTAMGNLKHALAERIIRNVVSITQMRINLNNKRMILRLHKQKQLLMLMAATRMKHKFKQRLTN